MIVTGLVSCNHCLRHPGYSTESIPSWQAGPRYIRLNIWASGSPGPGEAATFHRVKALRRFTVRPQLPEPLEPLGALIRNLRWSWHPASQDLFADIDRDLWARFEGDPLKLLGAVSVSRLQELAHDHQFLDRMHGLAADLDSYLTEPRWYQQQIDLAAAAGGQLAMPRAIAYFSMEFGVSEVLPNYSGGLGILAGDHLKSASDLGVPIIGVGLLYRYGYFWQSLSRRRLAAGALPGARPAGSADRPGARGRR